MCHEKNSYGKNKTVLSLSRKILFAPEIISVEKKSQFSQHYLVLLNTKKHYLVLNQNKRERRTL